MTSLFRDVRRGDAVLATLLTALGVLLMVANIRNTDPSVRMDSQSWLMVPVFAAATLPILWRRRSMPLVLVATAAALAVHVLAFGWVVRCGAGLPLSFALAYGAGRLTSRRQSAACLAATIGIQGLVQVQDSAAGWGVLPVTALMAAAVWGVGIWLRRRSDAVAGAAESVAPAAVGSFS